MSTFYKIRSKKNPEMFRMGGVEDKWNKSGKVWDTLGKLRSMITGCLEYNRSDISNWEIVEIETKVVAIKEVHEVVTQKRLLEMLAK